MILTEYNDQTNNQTPFKQLSVNVPKELTSSLETSREPVVVKIATEGGVAEISKESNGPIMEHIEVHLPSNIMSDTASVHKVSGGTPLTSSIDLQGKIPEGMVSLVIEFKKSCRLLQM